MRFRSFVIKRLQRTPKPQLTQEISVLATSEVTEKCNWISCYSQHGDLHEVDKSLMLVAALKMGAGD